jgi:hypothetical protein
MHVKLLRAGLAFAALPAVSGCTSVASLDCNEIADRARQISQDQPIKMQSIANVSETSRNEHEARCTGDATLVDGGTLPVYMRAYEEDGKPMVAYQGTPFG